MLRYKRRAVAIACLLLCAVLMLTGCGEEQKREEFRELAVLLIQRGDEVCGDIYLGGGLSAAVPDDYVPDYSSASYFPVDSERYTSIAELKQAAESVFLPEVAAQWLYPDAFGETSPVASGSDVAPLYIETDGVLEVNAAYSGETVYGTEWLFDSITVTELTEERATITIDTIYRDETENTVTVTFRNTQQGWRIAQPLYQ